MKEQMQIWFNSHGEKVACTEKLKVMQQNIEELCTCAQDAFEDGVLMDIDPTQLREYFIDLMKNLTNPYQKNNEDAYV
jgi:hypothetical protein